MGDKIVLAAIAFGSFMIYMFQKAEKEEREAVPVPKEKKEPPRIDLGDFDIVLNNYTQSMMKELDMQTSQSLDEKITSDALIKNLDYLNLNAQIVTLPDRPENKKRWYGVSLDGQSFVIRSRGEILLLINALTSGLDYAMGESEESVQQLQDMLKKIDGFVRATMVTFYNKELTKMKTSGFLFKVWKQSDLTAFNGGWDATSYQTSAGDSKVVAQTLVEKQSSSIVQRFTSILKKHGDVTETFEKLESNFEGWTPTLHAYYYSDPVKLNKKSGVTSSDDP